MPYDHGEKAGNKGDVWKHVILLSVMAKILPRRPAGEFRYFETHCGKMSYLLSPGGEWREGIGKGSNPRNDAADHPYFQLQDCPAEIGSMYRGSWSLVAAYLRRKGYPFRFTLCDTSDDVGQSVLAYAPRPAEAIEFLCTDGFTALKRSLHRQGLIFIDPPYTPPKVTHDWKHASDMAAVLARSSLPFLIWYPLVDKDHPQMLVDNGRSPGYEVQWKRKGGKIKMAGAGMVMGNCGSLFDSADFTFLKGMAVRLGGGFHVREALSVHSKNTSDGLIT
ncbi:MAG: 23S rRNA (adenine(2030)-N(6))-methyltransferase RlmJ [Deltaproteobacteria bacterium]|nr:23S rRNA (adenine(2030)-N(6))-methyltransferase RlmJ [Deltaproteobacteria bacterium]